MMLILQRYFKSNQLNHRFFFRNLVVNQFLSHKESSPIQKIHLRGYDIYIKRDDLYRLSGNKSRKLYWLLEKPKDYFQDKIILSYGGLQSNAMYSIAQLSKEKEISFIYFSKQVSENYKKRLGLLGNYKNSIELGMKNIQLNSLLYKELIQSKDFYNVVQSLNDPSIDFLKCICIPQGVAVSEAEMGILKLAKEINDFYKQWRKTKTTFSCTSEDVVLSVFLPCGTGTTAFYLSKHVDPHINIYAIPCVGDHFYLKNQMEKLSSFSLLKNLKIIELKKKNIFGKPLKNHLNMYNELKEIGIEIDLLYACHAWNILMKELESNRMKSSCVLYIHSGGLVGNSSQILRYQHHHIE